jgi:glutathione S-transferase
MLKLHITNKNYSSWSLRLWALMRALDIPFTEERHVFPASGAGELFRQFAPNGKVPCLEDQGLIVWESLAITEYLAESYPQVWPQDKIARAWARSACAEMHAGFSALRNQCGMSCGHRIEMGQLGEDLRHEIARIDELWCDGLNRFGGPWLTGAQFTAADAFYAPVAFRVQTYGLPLSAKAKNYHQQLLQHQAITEWYTAALAETWREPAHDQEVLSAGKLLADLRAQ